MEGHLGDLGGREKLGVLLDPNSAGFGFIVLIVQTVLVYRIVISLMSLRGHIGYSGFGVVAVVIIMVALIDLSALLSTKSTLRSYTQTSWPFWVVVALIAVATASIDPSQPMVNAACVTAAQVGLLFGFRAAFGAGITMSVAFCVALVRMPEGRDRLAAYWVQSGLSGPVHLIPLLYLVLAVGFGPILYSTLLQMEAVRRRERLSVARDLHDRVASSVSGIAMMARAAESGVSGRPVVSALLQQMAVAAQTVVIDTRSIISGLRVSSRLTLEEMLSDLAINLETCFGVRVHLGLVDAASLPTHADLALDICSVAEEAVRNAVRHGLADQVMIVMEARPNAWVLTIDDNGSGCSPADLSKKGHFGLIGARERVGQHGGSIVVSNRPEGGCRMRCVVPRAKQISRNR